MTLHNYRRFTTFSLEYTVSISQLSLFLHRTVENTVHYKILRICIINQFKTYQRVVISVSYISLNSNFHIPFKMLLDF